MRIGPRAREALPGCRDAVGTITQTVAVAVVVVLTVGVVVVLRSVAEHLWEGFRFGLDGHAFTNLLSEARLTSMIAEIMASIRRLLVIRAEAADFVAWF